MFTLKRIILGFLIIFFLSSLTKNFFEYRRNLEFYEGYKEDFDEAYKRNNELKSELVKNNDPYEVEKTIRNKLNMSKGDEVAVLLPEPTPTPVVITPTPLPTYLKWYDIFFGK